MGRAIPCLIRIVAECPRPCLIRVCASHNKTFPGHEAFILINPVDEAHVPRTAPGTPQANGRHGYPWPPVRPTGCPVGRDARVPSRDRRPPAAHAREAVSPNPEAVSPTNPEAVTPTNPEAVSPTLRAPRPSARSSGRDAKQGPRREAGASRVPDKQTHRWPPDGQSVSPGQRCDPAGAPLPELHIARAPKCQGRSTQTPLLWESFAILLPARGTIPLAPPTPPAKAMKPREHAKTSELEYVRTSARLRTPRRCWRECARAH